MQIEPGIEPGEAAVDDRDAIIEAAFSCLSEPHTGVVPIAAVLARALDRIADGNDGVPADQLAHWIGVAFEVIHNARSHGRATVLDSDEVRSAKGYLTAQEQWRIDRERSLAALLRRGRDDGSFPLARPERDAAAIRAVVSHELSRLRADGDWECARAAVVDFALRAVGAHTRDR
ncbi:TetR/AcrR family transcriptional regulator [Mycolicibacterium sp. CBMA 295]|uniref:TetR/AcrR family transcriptional regulator n=1 Tax=Mycolicibacterium sp. CBMA 295 TaxID=2606605 RepID=UPI002814E418|nr:TetR/AcrR family transcriptional regulator [Mycolicibacterium sp. CBMA 295]